MPQNWNIYFVVSSQWMYRFLFIIVFFGKRKNKIHKTFHILKMKAHFEKEPHFENENMFREKWRYTRLANSGNACSLNMTSNWTSLSDNRVYKYVGWYVVY